MITNDYHGKHNVLVAFTATTKRPPASITAGIARVNDAYSSAQNAERAVENFCVANDMPWQVTKLNDSSTRHYSPKLVLEAQELRFLADSAWRDQDKADAELLVDLRAFAEDHLADVLSLQGECLKDLSTARDLVTAAHERQAAVDNLVSAIGLAGATTNRRSDAFHDAAEAIDYASRGTVDAIKKFETVIDTRREVGAA